MDLPDKLLALQTAFADAGITIAFGGATALGFYSEPRATFDLDINIFVPTSRGSDVLDLLERFFPIEDRALVLQRIDHEGQVRLLWDNNYIDLFFQNTAFLDSAAQRIRQVEYRSSVFIPVLSAEDLILCKAAFSRPKDWLDIRNVVLMQEGRLDWSYIRYWLNEFYADDAEPAARLLEYRHLFP